ncbi:MAG TPA: anti-sigma F factor, partial [Clostridiales bacterium]|nr:anti-sigma F factor [Clostridiales bacterium]
NVVVHAYDQKDTGVMQIECCVPDDKKSIEIVVRDFGKGIKDVKEAVEPFFTTAQDDERSGMGFTIIDTFMDEMDVASVVDEGTVVKMKKVMKGC